MTEGVRSPLLGVGQVLGLLRWLRGCGHALVGVSGASFGAFITAVSASASREPVAVAACLPCHSAEVCWTDSVMASACDFRRLAADLRAAAAAAGDSAVAALYGGAGGAEAARGLLRGLLAELTDLRRFPPPVLAAAAVLVSATDDAYIAASSGAALHRHWAGSELRLHGGGHVTSFLFNGPAFRRACADAVARLRQYGPLAPFSARLCLEVRPEQARAGTERPALLA